MSDKESKQTMYYTQLEALSRQISSADRKLMEIDRRINNCDESIKQIPTRIARIRQSNFKVLTYLEQSHSSISETWANIRSEIKAIARTRKKVIRTQMRRLKRKIVQKHQSTHYDVSNLQNLETNLSNLQVKVVKFDDSVNGLMGGITKNLHAIEQDLKIAENTVSLTSQASFPWKDGETPIFALKAKDLNNDVDGIVTLTNLRFIFESETEVIVKKRLFIVTEKKQVRKLVIEKPIGIIHSLIKGRVGLLKGAGIYIEFKRESGQEEMKLDTKGYEADWMVRFYNFIVSGQADEELSTVQTPTVQEKPQVFICQICGAPYQDEVYKGQTSIKCVYCGAVTPIT